MNKLKSILFWPFTIWINCSSDLKNFETSWPSASNFKSFSRYLEQFLFTVGQNNFGNKIPFFLERGNLKSFFMAYKVCLALKTSLAFKLNHHQGQARHSIKTYVVWICIPIYFFVICWLVDNVVILRGFFSWKLKVR